MIDKNNVKREPIAIIGLGCCFPGGSNSPDEFWDKVLSEGRDAVTEIPPDRWDVEAYYHPDYTIKGKISVKWGGFIDDVDKFDPHFFGISPMEAVRMDPQQRKLLEASYQAIEDAGLRLKDLKGRRVGVYIGLSAHDYGDIGMTPTEHPNITGKTISGGSASIAANRISYVFDFRGPSFTIDTACSSSLVALHNACNGIWNNECPVAFVGGANSVIKPEVSMSFSKGGFLSPTGRCKTFDEKADGYIRSEGVGVAVLKPLSKAVADGDKIYATIIGTAINQDGATDGISMPSQEAQVAVLKDACRRAGVDPSKIQYVEAHGTGTAVGDPIEARSIGLVIGKDKKEGEKIIVGSVKSNIGHLEPASGMAGLIKLVMAMKKKKIPQNVHFKTPNSKIPFAEYNMKVPVKMMEWPKNDKMYAGINSFGFGGANAHVVLEGYFNKKKAKTAERTGGLLSFVLSAKSLERLKAFAESYIDFLEKNKKNNEVKIEDICYTSKVKRNHHNHRLALVVSSKTDLLDQLQNFVQDKKSPGMASGRVSLDDDKEKPKIVFVFSGQGPQWYAMGRELLAENELFRSYVEKVNKILKSLGWLKKEGSSLIEELNKSEEDSRINETKIAQPAIFALQVGLFELWKSLGIHPDAVVGHSIGEVAAAYASGALDLGEATRIIYWRSRSQSVAAGKGKMLAAALSIEEAKERIEKYKDLVAIAVVNGPNMLTLSGDSAALETISASLEEEDIFNRMLRVDIPFHSHYLDVIKDDFISSVGDVVCKDTDIALYSTVSGKLNKGTSLDSSYWYSNIRQSVLFYPAVKELVNNDFSVFLEISPHPILSNSIKDTLAEAGKEGIMATSLRRNQKESQKILKTLGLLYVKGFPVNWKESCKGNFIDLPFYPFVRDRYWIESEESKRRRIGNKLNHPHLKNHVCFASNKTDHIWDIQLDKGMTPYIEDHRVQGPLIYPGAGSCELAFACGMEAFGRDFCFIEDIYFDKAVFLPDDGSPPEIQLNLSSDDGSFGIFSRKGNEGNWTKHISGKLRHLGERFSLEDISLKTAQKNCTEEVDMEKLYKELFDSGLMLGPAFRGITTCRRNNKKSKYLGESIGEIIVPDSIDYGVENYNIHPAVLDACFQTLFGSVLVGDGSEDFGFCIPIHIRRLKFHQKPTKKLYSYTCLTELSRMFAVGDIRIYDENGKLCLEIEGFKCRFIEGSRGENENRLDRCIYEYQWKIKERIRQARHREPGEYIPSPLSLSEFSPGFIKEVQARPERVIYDTEFEPELNILTAAYIEAALIKLGFSFEPGITFSTDSFIKNHGIKKGYLSKLFQRTLEILSESGILKSTGKREWEVLKTPEEIDTELKYQTLKQEKRYSLLIHELEMLHKCGPFLYEIFSGAVDPVTLLFPDEEWDSTLAFYSNGYSFKKYNEIVRSHLDYLLKDMPSDRTLRVLEIGAGTGGMTGGLLSILPAERTEYFFTDVSPMFLVKAEERFSDYSFVNYGILDISKDPSGQGYDLNSFDIIVASDVMHTTTDLNKTLEYVNKLLSPNGLLVMLEVTQSPWWTDLVFGLTEGWWMFEDYDLRPSHPTLTGEKWIKVLGKNGFYDINAVSEAVSKEVSAQTVFIARRADEKTSMEPLKLPSFMEKNGNWIIFCDEKGVGKKIGSSLSKYDENPVYVFPGKTFKAEGDDKFFINPGSQEDMRNLFDKLGKRVEKLNGVLHFWNLDQVSTDKMSVKTLEDSYNTGTTVLYNLFREWGEHPANLWVITSNASPIDNLEKLSLSQTSVWGACRTIMHEYQNFDTTLVDLSYNITDIEIESLFEEICEETHAEEVALRGRKRYLHKFARVAPEEDARRAKKELKADASSFHLTTDGSGMLNNLFLQEKATPLPGSGEVKIKVAASGLNFKDVMIATGMLHEDAPKGGYTGKAPGMECSGTITAVGKGVTDFKKGDEVIAIASDAIASSVITKADFVVKKPESFSFSDAATIPFAYLTAYYSIIYLGRLEKGERILIHSASGGVGFAAVRLALALGAEVFATAGNEEKRKYLRKSGVKHVMDSRSTGFAEEIQEITGGEGVDMVLNSLSGSAIYKNLTVLRKYGRFVEIGKTDIYENNRISLRPFWNNLSYFAVDIDKLLTEKPELCRKLILEYMSFFEKNASKLIPHPKKTFPISRVPEAFRFMAAANHIGKVVITQGGETITVSPSEDIKTIIKSDGTYIVTGGFSGLGLECSKWLVKKGVRSLAIISRSGAKTEKAQKFIAEMTSRGVVVYEEKADIADEKSIKSIIEKIKKTKSPIRGIIHSAMVLDDAILADMTHERFMKAVRPKVMGAWNLHNLTLDQPVDFFASFSSISGEYGALAQSNYAAANVFLDILSYYRQANGLPGITVSWGVITDVGFVARNEKVSSILESQGWRGFSPDEALGVLERLIMQNHPHRTALDVDWPAISKYFLKDKDSFRFSHLMEEVKERKSGELSLKSSILEADVEERMEIIQRNITDSIARILGTSASKIDKNDPISNMGLDSLMANQLRNWIQVKLDIDFSMMKIMRGPSVVELSKQLLADPSFQVEKTKDEAGSEKQKKPEVEKWIIRSGGNGNCKIRLFCFPYMAGGASSFITWADAVKSDIEVCPVQYPGREERKGEKPYDDVNKLVEAIAKVMLPLLDKPFAFYGHSIGAAVAYKLSQYLVKKYNKSPVVFFAAGWLAPHMKSPFKIIEEISEAEIMNESGKPKLLEHMRNLEIPEEILSDNSLMEELLPSIRADILLGKRYESNGEPPLKCPVVACAGENDTVFTLDHVKAWKKYTAKNFDFRVFKGGHMFLRDDRDSLLNLIMETLQKAVD